jgi:hypothetical protein
VRRSRHNHAPAGAPADQAVASAVLRSGACDDSRHHRGIITLLLVRPPIKLSPLLFCARARATIRGIITLLLVSPLIQPSPLLRWARAGCPPAEGAALFARPAPPAHALHVSRAQAWRRRAGRPCSLLTLLS